MAKMTGFRHLLLASIGPTICLIFVPWLGALLIALLSGFALGLALGFFVLASAAILVGAGYRVTRAGTGTVGEGILVALIAWFFHHAVLVGLPHFSGPPLASFGKVALRYGWSYLHFTPIVVALAAIGGWLGRRSSRPRREDGAA